jgi:hypothetical protein
VIRLLTTTAPFTADLLLGGAAFAQTSQPNAPSRAAPAGTAPEALNQADQTSFKEAGIGGVAEVELGKLAQKSENTDVKSSHKGKSRVDHDCPLDLGSTRQRRSTQSTNGGQPDLAAVNLLVSGVER